MTAVTARPLTVVPYRWIGHGIDVRAVRVDGQWRYLADDLEPIIGPLHLIADIVCTPGEVVDVAVAGTSHATLTRGHVAMWLDAAARTPLIDEFTTWFARLSSHLDANGDIVAAAASHPEPAATADRLFGAQHAAQILSRTPGIDIGPIQLFRLMHSLGWITRDDYDQWTPTDLARRAGYLTTRPVRIGTAWTGHYLQVVLAEAALSELQRVLAGGTTPTLDRPEILPTLVDIP